MIDQQLYVLSLVALALALGVPLAILARNSRRAATRIEDQHVSERAMLRTLIDNVPDFIYAKDANGRFLVANMAVARNLGLSSPDQILGKHDFDLFPEVFAREFHADEQAIIRSGEPLIDREEVVQSADGDQRHVLTSKIPIRDATGRVVGLVGIGRDVTVRTRLLGEMRAAREAAEAANRSKSEFVANMSHEIRTPINGVLGMAELMLETSLSPVQRDYAQTIHDSGKALLTVINDILDFSKIEAGKLDIEQVHMDLLSTLEDVTRMLAFHAHRKRLELTVDIDEALPSAVRGDPARLRQILTNLGGNAVKFTSAGEVAVKVSVLEATALYTLVRFEVRDTGIGIPADRIDKLFQPFTQVDASTTRQFGGTGLGLSIVRRLVELMGGECGVSSTLGSGSKFWFTLRFDAAEKAVGLTAPTPLALKNRRILVVDDNATNLKILSSQLVRCGIEATCAASGAEALVALRRAQAEDRPFDAALLDHDMPETDGSQLGKAINSDPNINSVRLVLLTSSGQPGEGTRFARQGFAGYLLKPVAQGDLVDTLMIVLNSSSEDWHTQSHPIVTQHELQAMRAREKKLRVLLAEDNAVNQKVAVNILEKMGCTVTVAVNGREAVRVWGTGHFDLILMDCQMPEMDGYAATREIRSRETSAHHIPIVALTAHAMKGADEECRAAGMDDYITKPIDRELLRSCLERYRAEIEGGG